MALCKNIFWWLLPGALMLCFNSFSQISSGIIVIKTPSVAADSVITTHVSDTVCLGESTQLVAMGGQLGTDAHWTWFEGGCNSGTALDTGQSITITPAGTLTYYCTAEGGCNAVICRQITVYVDLTPECMPLPLHLLDFKAVLYRADKGLVSWTTADESGCSSFLLEESEDGLHFRSLAAVPAAGDVTGHTYQFTDEALTTGRNFYRLKILQQDGAYAYSPVRSLWYYPEEMSAGILYPNPTDGLLYFEFESREAGTLHTRIYNIVSRKVYEERTNAYIKGKNTVRMDVRNIPDGAYLFLYDKGKDGEQQTIKFIKKTP